MVQVPCKPETEGGQITKHFHFQKLEKKIHKLVFLVYDRFNGIL